MKKLRTALLVAGALLVGAFGGPRISPSSAEPLGSTLGSAIQTPVLSCGPTSTSGIWGCWNNIVGRYTITFPSTMWCPADDSCAYNYNGPLKRADVRHVQS